MLYQIPNHLDISAFVFGYFSLCYSTLDREQVKGGRIYSDSRLVRDIPSWLGRHSAVHGSWALLVVVGVYSITPVGQEAGTSSSRPISRTPSVQNHEPVGFYNKIFITLLCLKNHSRTYFMSNKFEWRKKSLKTFQQVHSRVPKSSKQTSNCHSQERPEET